MFADDYQVKIKVIYMKMSTKFEYELIKIDRLLTINVDSEQLLSHNRNMRS